MNDQTSIPALQISCACIVEAQRIADRLSKSRPDAVVHVNGATIGVLVAGLDPDEAWGFAAALTLLDE